VEEQERWSVAAEVDVCDLYSPRSFDEAPFHESAPNLMGMQRYAPIVSH
jgi:hypothetical protein